MQAEASVSKVQEKDPKKQYFGSAYGKGMFFWGVGNFKTKISPFAGFYKAEFCNEAEKVHPYIHKTGSFIHKTGSFIHKTGSFIHKMGSLIKQVHSFTKHHGQSSHAARDAKL